MPKDFEMPSLIEANAVAKSQGSDAKSSLEFVEKIELAKQADLEFAVGVVAEVKDKLNEVDEQRQQFINPLKKVVKDIDASFKPAISHLKDCEKVLKTKISEYNTQCIKQRSQLIADAGDAVNHGDPDVASALIEEAEELVVEKVEGLSLRESWKCEITDSDAVVRWAVDNDRLDLIMPNEKALKAITKATKSDPAIPGWLAQLSTSVAITVDKVQR